MGRLRVILLTLTIAVTPPSFAQSPNPAPLQLRGIPNNPPAAQTSSPLKSNESPAVSESIAAAKQIVAATGPATPCVVVEKRGPEVTNAGQPLVYDLIVRNTGTIPVHQVRVEDELPSGARYMASEPAAEVKSNRMTWNLGQLDANDEKKIRVEVQPSGEGEFHTTAMVTFSVAAAMRTQIVRPKIAIALSAPDQVFVGDAAPLQIQISNPGTGPATNILLRVKLPAGLTHPGGGHIEADLGTLAAGESKSIPLSVTGATGGPQVTEVIGTADGGLESTAKSQITVQQPKLALKRSAPGKVNFRGEVTEEYEVTNSGNAIAANVSVTEILPAGLEFVGASDGAMYDPAIRAVTWKIGQHAPGAVKTIVLKSKANSVGDVSTKAVATADRGVEAKAEGNVAVEGIPALRLEVADLEDPAEVGGELTYEIRVFNQGSCACTGIRISCEIPDGLTPLETIGATAGRVQGNKVVFDSLPKLATKADAVFRVKVRGDQPGDYRFKVQMNCEQLRLPVNKEESSRVYKN